MTKITKEEAKLELLRRKCRSNFWNFCLYMNYDFWESREEQLKEVANALTDVYNNGGKIAISTPPRTGKSMLANHFICWCLLNDLDNSIIRASYSDNLSTELNQNARQMIEEEKFKLLLYTPLVEVENNKSKMRFKGSKRANVYATSVGGSSTGFGGNIIIADDIYKDHNEALSDTVNNKTINWYYSAFASRLDGEKQIEVVIGTRWRVGELVDVLEQNNYFDYVFKIKALKDDNTSFNENIITTDKLLSLQNVMHESIFNSMYQQMPMEGLDLLISQEELTFIKEYKVINYKYRIMVVDIADKGTDRTTSCVFDVYHDKIVALDLLTDVRSLEHTEPRLDELVEVYKPDYLLVEENKESYWARTFVLKHDNGKTSAETFRTTQNKKVKILLNSPKIKDIIFIETEDSEYNEFIRRMCKFDMSQNNQHDDEIDVMAMAINSITLIEGNE